MKAIIPSITICAAVLKCGATFALTFNHLRRLRDAHDYSYSWRERQVHSSEETTTAIGNSRDYNDRHLSRHKRTYQNFRYHHCLLRSNDHDPLGPCIDSVVTFFLHHFRCLRSNSMLRHQCSGCNNCKYESVGSHRPTVLALIDIAVWKKVLTKQLSDDYYCNVYGMKADPWLQRLILQKS